MDHSIKTRLLKKYEGVTHICATEGDDPRMDFYSPFGPMIAKVKLPAAVLDNVNEYADGMLSANRGQELVLPREVTTAGGKQSLAQLTADLIKRYVAGCDGTRVESVEFEIFWVVSQYASTPSPVHFHTGDISGVLYLKVPEVEAGQENKSYISGRQAGYINFLIGGKQRFSRALVSFRPEVGDFYIFPGWLLHGAEPFRGKGERRSLAFNAFVKSAST